MEGYPQKWVSSLTDCFVNAMLVGIRTLAAHPGLAYGAESAGGHVLTPRSAKRSKQKNE